MFHKTPEWYPGDPVCHPQTKVEVRINATKRGSPVDRPPTNPINEDGIGRMQFLLSMRRRGITDAAVLRALDEVPREHFVEVGFADAAYADQALPIPCGQTISQPFVVAYMTEQLEVRSNHRVLEIGAGSGYQAAVLSRLAREVITVERFPSRG